MEAEAGAEEATKLRPQNRKKRRLLEKIGLGEKELRACGARACGARTQYLRKIFSNSDS